MADELIYPKGGTLYLHAKVADHTVDICRLIDTLVLRDQRIAQLEAESVQKDQRIGQLEVENTALKQGPGNVVTMVPAAD